MRITLGDVRKRRGTRERSSQRRSRNGQTFPVASRIEALEKRLALSTLTQFSMDDAAPAAWTGENSPILGTTPAIETSGNDVGPQPLSQPTGDDDPGYFAGFAAAADQGTGIPELHSKPDAPASVYLDFDGHYEPTWGQFTDLDTPVFDTNGNTGEFSTSEINAVIQVWQRVAEDFAPFNLNVTTVDPGNFSNGEALRLAIGGSSSDWYEPQGGGPAGGVAYINSFTNFIPNVAYVFPRKLSNSPKYIAEAASHEAGHAFGLHHQSVYDSNGNKTREYNPGNSQWAPIMGIGYNAARTTWHDGPNSRSSTSFQDELAILSSVFNGFGYRDDDHADSASSATPLAVAAGSELMGAGIIETMDDVDYFSFSAGSGELTIIVDVADVGPNLDAVLELYDLSGSRLAAADPSGSLGATIALSVPAGEYTLAVRNHGTYGDLGQYTVHAVVAAAVPPSLTLELADDAVGEADGAISATVTRHDADITQALVVNLESSDPSEASVPTAVTIPAGAASVVFAVDAVADNWIDGAQAVTVTASGTGFGTVAVDLTIIDETAPVLTGPRGLTADGTPTFAWNAVDNAARYDLWVYNESTNTHEVIREVDLAATSFTPAEPLPSAAYRFWVRAFTAEGRASDWSVAMTFAVGSVPDIPALTEPGAVTADTTPTFVWDDVEAARYDLWLYHLTTNTHEIIREENLTAPTFTPSAELPLGSYRAWVRAFNAAGLTNGWSVGWDFVIGSVPAAPVLTAPLGNTFEPRPTLQWDAVEGAVHYEVWIRNETSGEQNFLRETQWAATSYTPPRDWPSGHYRVWLRAVNANGQAGEWSPPGLFSIGIPPAPTLLGPEGTTSTPTPEFSWTASQGAVRYDLWVYYAPTDTHGIIRDQNVSSTTYTPSTDLEPGRYLFWVRAFNADGLAGPWSLQMEFTIGQFEGSLQQDALDENAAEGPFAAPVPDSAAPSAEAASGERTVAMEAGPVVGPTAHARDSRDATVDAVLAQWPETSWWMRRPALQQNPPILLETQPNCGQDSPAIRPVLAGRSSPQKIPAAAFLALPALLRHLPLRRKTPSP